MHLRMRIRDQPSGIYHHSFISLRCDMKSLRCEVKSTVHVTNARSILFLLGDNQDKIVGEDKIDHDVSIVTNIKSK